VLVLVARALRYRSPARVRRWAMVAGVLVLAQVGLGIASVLTTLAVAPVSLHTLGAAALLSALVHVATLAHSVERPRLEPSPATVV
jgi:cytochrome c oxidase assembly protein subunit 15